METVFLLVISYFEEATGQYRPMQTEIFEDRELIDKFVSNKIAYLHEFIKDRYTTVIQNQHDLNEIQKSFVLTENKKTGELKVYTITERKIITA